MIDFSKEVMPKEHRDKLLNFVMNPRESVGSISEFNNTISTLNNLSEMLGFSKAKDTDLWKTLDSESNDIGDFVKNAVVSSNRHIALQDIKKGNLMFLYAVVVKHNDNLCGDMYRLDF